MPAVVDDDMAGRDPVPASLATAPSPAPGITAPSPAPGTAADTARPDTAAARPVHLRRGGTSVLVDLAADGGPAIVHWGSDLGGSDREGADLDFPDTLESLCVAARPQRVSGGLDRTARLGLMSTEASGWLGTPGLSGHRDGADAFPRWTRQTVTVTTDADADADTDADTYTSADTDADALVLDLTDEQTELSVRVELRLGPSGLLAQRATLRNEGSRPYEVGHLSLALPVPWDATEILDTTGRHLRERSAQRRAFTYGRHVRDSRRGRPGADATLLLAAGRPGVGFETGSGTVHGIHLGWSGNSRVFAERVTTGEAFLGAGELLAPGEVRLAPGEELTTPWLYGSWGDGLDELAGRFHDHWRARPAHPTRPRPITLNTWEAVYFDHDLARLTALADAAARVGVERFVLDDGWFLGRRDDTAGLGDWSVDPDVWPDGLWPLVTHVRELGMEFGLWVEPEMVNPDSALAREHPEWILRGRAELPPSARQQQVLDLSRPGAYAHVAGRLHALLETYPIAYLKWDHNRDLVAAGSGARGGSRVREHTLAVYRLLDELKAAHPGLEIESCASGGARVDLGILARTDRVWTSDCLDPIERLENQKYTGLVVPPEMMGMHLSAPTVHSTGRTVPLELSGAVALVGHVGIEWDLTSLDEAGLDRVAAWVAFAKDVRELVATGRMYHADSPGDGLDLRGVVAADGSRAVVTLTRVTTEVAAPPGRVRIPGLDPHTSYTVRVAGPGGAVQEPAQSPLEWACQDTVLTGRQLGVVGLRPPVQHPQRATILEFVARRPTPARSHT